MKKDKEKNENSKLEERKMNKKRELDGATENGRRDTHEGRKGNSGKNNKEVTRKKRGERREKGR